MERLVLRAKEIRVSQGNGQKRVGGYAATFNTLSHDLGGFVERIAPGAFDRVLRSKDLDCVCTFNHDVNAVLGRTTSGTLRLNADAKGLQFECDLPNTTAGRDTWEGVKRGDLCGCSFAFNTEARMSDYKEEEFDADENGLTRGAKLMVKKLVRTIRDFSNLIDVSVVTHPAYPGTSVDARNLVSAECRSLVDAMRTTAKREEMRKADELLRAAQEKYVQVIHQSFVRGIILD